MIVSPELRGSLSACHLHTGRVTQDQRLGLVLTINLAMIISLVIVGVLTHSLGVLASVADAAAAIGVAVSGAIILIANGLYRLDSAVALVIAVVVGYHAVRLMRRVLADLRVGSHVSRPTSQANGRRGDPLT